MMPTVWEDTRQQVGKHENKRRWFKAHGVEVKRKKLETGDYERADGASNILIDTKRSLDEVSMDVGRDHARFARELDRARDAGCRLVVLIEVGAPYKSLDDVARWYPMPCRRCELRGHFCEPRSQGRCHRFKRKPMQGPTLLRIMRTLEERHGCRFEIVHPAHSAARICELLGIEVSK